MLEVDHHFQDFVVVEAGFELSIVLFQNFVELTLEILDFVVQVICVEGLKEFSGLFAFYFVHLVL